MEARARLKATSMMLFAALLLALRAASADGPVPTLPWLHEGLVLNYTWYAARAAGNGSDYQEDDQGGWMDARTGRRLARIGQQGTSGSGWTQIVISCIDGDKVVVAVSRYSNAGALGRNQPVPQAGGEYRVAPVANPGEFWMDPNRLATLRTNPAQHILVTRMPWKTGSGATETIRVQIIKDGNYDDHIYDARTGLCLHMAGAVRGPAPRYVGPGDMGQGDTTLSRSDFIGARDLAIPWAGEGMPEWATMLRALHYRGPVISRGPLPAGNSFSFADLATVAHGRGWVQFASTFGTQTPGAPAIVPEKAELAFGRAQFGGLWIVPGRLQQGQVLDQDPVTKMQTVVAKADDRSIVISQRNAAGELDYEYDRRTGMRIAFSFYNVLDQWQRTLRLQGRE